MNFNKYHNLAIKEEIKIDSINEIVEFIEEKTAYDHFCKKCKSNKTFIQTTQYSDKDIVVSEGYSSIEAYHINSIKVTDAKIKYVEEYSGPEKELTIRSNVYVFKRFSCPICKNIIIMIYKININSIMKVYQTYTKNNLDEYELSKYKSSRILKDADINNIVKARKCLDEELHIGAFAYLRTVLEQMLENLYLINKNDIKLKDAHKKMEFNRIFFEEKIKYLKDYLPKILNEPSTKTKYKKMYKILSEQIHNFTEEECKLIYQNIETVILLILEEDNHKIEKSELLKELNKNYNKINSQS